MMWLAVPALALMLAATVQGNQCKNPKDIHRALFTPEFDFDENLSFKECGKWPDKSKAAPWRIAVGRQDGATCFGVLLSDYNFITSQCTEVANDFRKDPSNVKAHTGLCYDQKLGSGDATTDCKLNNQGLELEIKSVEVLGDDPETQLHLWRLAKVLKNINPICLFNRNRQHSGGYSGERKDYNMYDRKWIGNYAVKLGGAPKTADDASVELCVKTSSCQNAPTDRQDFSGDFLVMEMNKRLFLRGFFFWPIFDGRYFTYTDVVPFIKEVVTKSYDMYLMPEIPIVKPKTDFAKSAVFNGACGQPAVITNTPNWQRGKTRGHMKRSTEQRTALDHVHGGVDAPEKAYPWHASLSYKPQKGIRTIADVFDFCGATLVSKRVVVTAAHCLYKKGSSERFASQHILVTLGMNTVDDIETLQGILGEKTLLHPYYNKQSKVNDVALVLLEKSVEFTAYVRPICLWDDDYGISVIKDTTGVVAGWGVVNSTHPTYQPNRLQVGYLQVRDHRDCYMQEQQFFGQNLKPGINFCAGGNKFNNSNVAACQGDSGGGFVIKKGSKWFLRGIVSYGISKKNAEGTAVCDDDFPSLYADIANSVDWIVQQVTEHEA